jgi:WD40 repeat protein
VALGPGPGGRVLSVPDLNVLSKLKPPAGEALAQAVWSEDGDTIAALLGRPAGNTVKIDGAATFDSATGRVRARLHSLGSAPAGLAVTPSGDRVAGVSADGTGAEWDAGSGRVVARLSGPPAGGHVAYSRDGARLAIPRADGTTELWRAGNGRRERVLRGPAPAAGGPASAPPRAAFSSDGRLVATAGPDAAVRLWDTGSGRPKGVLRAGAEPFGSVDFSQDGRLLTAGAASSAHVWRLPEGDRARELRPSGMGARFSADGKTIFAAAAGRVAAWHAPTGDLLFQVAAQAGDGSSTAPLLAAGSASDVALYDCELCGDLERLLAIAKRNSTRELSDAERARFLHEG